MKNMKIIRIAALVALFSGATFSQTRAVRLVAGVWEDLGTLSGDTSAAMNAINASGQIAGVSGDPKAISYSSGVMTNLGTLGGTDSDARAINSSGQIVGLSRRSGSPERWSAFLYDSGSMSDLGRLGTGVNSQATGISDTGKVVGISDTVHAAEQSLGIDGPSAVNQRHAFSFSVGGSLVDLGTLGGGDSYAFAISPDGSIIVGVSHLGSDEPALCAAAPARETPLHVFKHSSGTMTDVGTTAGGMFWPLFGVDNSGVIIGTERTCGFLNRGFYYDTGFHDIPLLTGDTQSNATGIDAGVIVGRSFPSGHPWKFTISGAVLVDLGLAKSGGGNWTEVTPTGINAAGVVVGFARSWLQLRQQQRADNYYRQSLRCRVHNLYSDGSVLIGCGFDRALAGSATMDNSYSIKAQSAQFMANIFGKVTTSTISSEIPQMTAISAGSFFACALASFKWFALAEESAVTEPAAVRPFGS
jgi:probable HAF family extracellular repeat protein